MLLLSIIIAFLPSLIWLALFLREDVHPEPNRLVRRAFAAGMIVTIPTLALQAFFYCLIPREHGSFLSSIPAPCSSSPFLTLPEGAREALFLFIGIALVEEFMKYMAVRLTILRDSNFDEPIDALLYLVIAALGFAAVENALTVSNAEIQSVGLFGPGGVLTVLGARSLSATLLHTLTSGIVGFALARSFFTSRPPHFVVALGLLVAAAIHAAYNGIVGDRFPGSAQDAMIGNVVLLLILTGGMLLVMMRNLRQTSEKHRWVNLKEGAEEIS